MTLVDRNYEETKNAIYQHTQRAPLFHLFHVIAAILFLVAVFARDQPPAAGVCLAVAVLMVFLALMFRQLTVEDEGNALAIRFGPLSVFRKRIRYEDISHVEPGRSSIIDGWGIHWVIGRGWTYNLWGFDCAKLTVNGKTVRIGTDDVAGLVDLIRRKSNLHGQHNR